MLIIENPRLTNFVIDHRSSLISAARLIENNERKTIVATRNDLFYGVLSDGDIRKSLLHGISSTTTISQFVNRNPIAIRDVDNISYLDRNTLRDYFQNYPWISLIPVIDSSNKPLAVVIPY